MTTTEEMSKSSTESPTTTEMSKSSTESPTTTTSFSSLPFDVILNCLARISRFHYPTLSLVSKGFRSLIASPELETTRSRMGITEDHLCFFLDLNKKNPNPRWFLVSPIPTQKSKPIPSFPHQYPKSSTIVSNGSKIYIIGGFVRRKRSKRVLILDCRSQQCRRLPNMRLPRVSPAADVIAGKIYVIGGYDSNNIDDWGEVYDPKTQTWEPLLPTTLDLTVQKSEVPGKLVMGGKVYAMDDVFELTLLKDVCLVEIEFVLCQISLWYGMLVWRDAKSDDSGWGKVEGLDGILPDDLILVANSDGGRRRVTVWWKSEVEIWCAEISFERRGGLEKLWGFVEWSKNVFTYGMCGDIWCSRSGILVFTYDICDSPPDILSAIVTY